MIANHHFNKKTISSLHKKGIYIIGLQSIPDMNSNMPWANSSNGYIIDDNGISKVVTFQDIIKMSK